MDSPFPSIPSGIFFHRVPLTEEAQHDHRPNHQPFRQLQPQPHVSTSNSSSAETFQTSKPKNTGPQSEEFYAFHVADIPTGEDDAGREYLPLLEVSLDVKVIATVSQTLLRQTFANGSNTEIKQATYCFPLYDGSVVTAFRCWVSSDNFLEGKVKPKKAAKAEFLDAISRQRTAALFEELTPEIFETSLGNILPHTIVKVEISYVNELKADLGGDGILVTIPTSVAPRYGTPPGQHPQGLISNPKYTEVENGLRIQVEVSSPVPVSKLESRTHPISVELGAGGSATTSGSFGGLASAPTMLEHDPKKARATLSDRATTLGKDFVLLILAVGSTLLASRAILEPHPSLSDHSALRVTVNPRDLLDPQVAIEDAKTEIIFLADRSGSMGNKIEALQRAMRVFLKSMPPKCFLNICSFGSHHSLLWPVSKPCTEYNVDIATQYVTHSFGSDMGGTEILSALKHTVTTRNTRECVITQIILLTDGEVWDEEDVVRFVSETTKVAGNQVRFFALGIGDAVSHRLVEGIGQQGGGFAEVVAVDAAGRWESRVIRMLKGALTPSQWQLEIELGQEMDKSHSHGVESTNFDDNLDLVIRRPPITQAPNSTSFMHPFRRSSVYFLVDQQLLLHQTSITIEVILSSGAKVKKQIPLELVDEAQTLTVHHLTAKALMNDLESGRSWMHADKYQSFQLKDPVAFERAVQKEAENIGMKWGISGKWTSFVAVDTRDRIQQMARIYRAERSELMDLTRPRRNHTGTLSAANFGDSVPTCYSPFLHSGPIHRLASINQTNSMGESIAPNMKIVGSSPVRAESSTFKTVYQHRLFMQSPEMSPTLDSLISQQHFLGYYDLGDSSLRSWIQLQFNSTLTLILCQILQDTGSNSDTLKADTICDTLLAVTFIKIRYAESAELWELVVSKAERWLKDKVSDAEVLEKLWWTTQDNARIPSAYQRLSWRVTTPSDVSKQITESTNTKHVMFPEESIESDEESSETDEESVETDVVRNKALKRQCRR